MEGAWIALPVIAITFALLPGVVAIAGLVYGIYVALREVLEWRKARVMPRAAAAEEITMH